MTTEEKSKDERKDAKSGRRGDAEIAVFLSASPRRRVPASLFFLPPSALLFFPALDVHLQSAINAGRGLRKTSQK